MSTGNSVTAHVKRYFLSGMLVVVPIILTFIVLRFLFDTIDGILEPLLHNILGYYRTGLGLLTTLLIILLAGVLTRNFIGARLYRIGDKVLHKVPIIRPIYSASKQLLEAITTTGDSRSFSEVALIEYPRKGAYALCFVSRRFDMDMNGSPERFAACFVASTPTPVSGMVILVPEREVIGLDMTVEEGVKFLVSGGVASPALIRKRADRPVTSDGEALHETG